MTSNPFVGMTLEALNLLKEQKRFEDGWASNNKMPEYNAITLNLASAAKGFKR